MKQLVSRSKFIGHARFRWRSRSLFQDPHRAGAAGERAPRQCELADDRAHHGRLLLLPAAGRSTRRNPSTNPSKTIGNPWVFDDFWAGFEANTGRFGCETVDLRSSKGSKNGIKIEAVAALRVAAVPADRGAEATGRRAILGLRGAAAAGVGGDLRRGFRARWIEELW